MGRQVGFALAAILLSCIADGCDKSPSKPEKLATADWSTPAYSEPIWSPDGLRLAFNHRPLDSITVDQSGYHHYYFNDSLAGFWTINSNGANQTRVVPASLGDPAWAPDGSWIAFGNDGDIYKVKVTALGIDSSSTQQLTFQGIYYGPAWNPSSTTLIFYRPLGSGAVSGLYRLHAGGGAPEHIGGDGWTDPDWSPDGSRILFVERVGDYMAISSADTLGNSPAVIRGGLLGPRYPKWSPDGKTIAFIDNEPGTDLVKLWLMNADGSNLHEVTSDPVGHGFAWHGNQIAYVRFDFVNHTYQNGVIWTVDVPTGALHQLTYSGPNP